MKIYHYSNKDFKGYIKPDFFGENSFSKNSCNISGIKRIYFYTVKKPLEYYFNNCRFLYIAEVNQSKLYDITKGILFLTSRYNKVNSFFQYLIKNGYIGIIDKKSCVVSLFKAVKINSQADNKPEA